MVQEQRVIVTGGSGKAGTWVVRDLVAHGYQVLNLDLQQAPDLPAPTLLTDLTDAGQVFNALCSHVGPGGIVGATQPQPVAAVIHFAAIPRLGLVPDSDVFRINVLATYNLLDAAAKLGIRKVIIASSEAAYGIAFAYEHRDPLYFPLDEEYPVDPMDSYALSKVCSERVARAFHLRGGMDVYAFRIGNVIEPDDYPALIASFDRPEQRKRMTWSYIDARDLARACRRAIESTGLGYQIFNIANDEVSSNLPTRILLQRYYPGVPIHGELGEKETLLNNRKARDMLQFRPQHTWMAARAERAVPDRESAT